MERVQKYFAVVIASYLVVLFVTMSILILADVGNLGC